ncbi:glycerophosphodiester phosphodiesterase GDPD1, chloroplastic-like [Senna tora]|uniref:glycerophosphodiester phosphodiesterase n=1 Tax=Senna tora TaxID=362788 RepID=A0A835CDQ2_9FABA|nr:glycerophosphodiester phosphodiesterase GDPD1, chloroplastic-like [Senna tora]
MGMNMSQQHHQYSSDPTTTTKLLKFKENSLLAFNAASHFPIHFLEFDVQVTTDDCPVIFHDIFILTQDKGAIIESRVTDLTSNEFLSFGPQKEHGKVVKPLLRKTKDGTIFPWVVENDDALCTLQDVFHNIKPSIGFNIELKFDDQVLYGQEKLTHVVQVILKVVNEYAKDRPIIFSTFQPDAALLIRKLQGSYPVFFLTNGGCELYKDTRRNSLEEAIKLCLEGGLQGIVAQVKAILRDTKSITRIKESKLSLFTYGPLNNVPEIVYFQYLMGVEGVIVDLVQEITEAIPKYASATKVMEESIFFDGDRMFLPENLEAHGLKHQDLPFL